MAAGQLAVALAPSASSPGLLQPSQRPAPARQPCPQRLGRRRLVTTASRSSGGRGGGGGGEDRERAPWLLHALGSQRAGSEYGEGFIQFKGLSGEQENLDVDTLNEQLKVQGRDRLRHSMRPDEAFGLIFDFDNVIADTRQCQRAAWQAVAAAEGLPYPSVERPQMFDLRPERAVTDVLMWTRDWNRARELAWLVATEYARLLLELPEPRDGVTKWLQLMSSTKVPCALVTSLDFFTTGLLLQRLGLRQYFTCLVTADDDMETMAQRYLSAAIKLGRPPNQCVVFAACPTAVTAAHNTTMKAVAMLGVHKAFTLKNADLTCANMADLSVYNIRRLFAMKGSEMMDLRHKFAGKPPPRRRLMHATDDGPER